MKINIEAKKGKGNYFNLRRQHETTYKADLVHHTSIGWVLEHDIKVSLHPSEFTQETIRIKAPKNSEEAGLLLLDEMVNNLKGEYI